MRISLMVNHFRQVYILLACLLLVTLGCSRKKEAALVWDVKLFRIGSQSSPRTVDLNGDGVLDIVMGAGLNEYQKSNQGIIALNGETGDLLWQQESPDQVYGSATFYDVNGDGVKDVFIGGRSPHFKALNGKNGEILWEYQYDHFKNDSILKHARFNFNNSLLVTDQNNDGLQDLLTINGGNSKADPYSEANRFPSVLMLLDSKTGNILAADTMPDGGESYMSPLCFTQSGEKDLTLVFGTGGETISGNLYVAKLSDLLSNTLSNAKVIASEKGHGFIAPPVLVDITKDGYYDIIAISHNSTIFAIDGKNLSHRWTRKINNTECSNSFAVGQFTGDETPDFFTFVSKGQWPGNSGSLQIMIDGADGRIAYMDSIGCTGFSSPVVYDLNGDRRDEAIISINEFDCSLGFTGNAPASIQNKLIAIDFKTNSINVIDQSQGFKNIFSTPWVGDIDADGYLDIVHCQYFHHSDLLSFLGMRVKRIDVPVKIRQTPKWGSYMGSNGDGIYSSP